MHTSTFLTALATFGLCQTSLARNLPAQKRNLVVTVVTATTTAPAKPHGEEFPGTHFYIDHVEVTASGEEFVWLNNPDYPGTEDFKVTREQAATGRWQVPSGHSLDTLFSSAWDTFSKTHVGSMPTVTTPPEATPTIVKITAITTTNADDEDAFEVHTSGVIDLPESTLPPGLEPTGFVNLPHNNGESGCERKTPGKGHLFFYHPTWFEDDKELRESWLFYIDTPWKVSYPGQLRRALEKEGFVMVDAPNTCEGWWKFSPVRKASVTRGRLEMKVPIGYKSEKWSTYNDLWMMIEEIMEDTFPHGEITMIVLGSFAIVAVLGIVIRWICLKNGWNGRLRKLRIRSAKKRVAEDDCVELRDQKKLCANCGVDMPAEA